MSIQKVSSGVVLVTMILSSFGVFFISPLSAQAQEAEVVSTAQLSTSAEVRQCPIDGFAVAEFIGSPALEIESRLETTIELKNTSTYVLGGVRIGLGIYTSESQTVPDYWFVTEQYQLPAGVKVSVPLSVDASVLPAGTYTLRTFSMQGDAVSVLGAVTRGVSDDAIVVTKQTAATSDVAITVDINTVRATGQVVSIEPGEGVSVAITTTNNNSLPLLDSSMVGVIGQGEIMLGTAVREMKIDTVKLVPGGERITKLTDQFPQAGPYSVYAGLLSQDALQPLVQIPLQLGAGVAAESWAYLSKVGVTTEDLTLESKVLGCFSYIGKNSQSSDLIETLGLTLEVNDGEKVVSSSEIRTDSKSRKNYVSIQPGVTLAKSFVTATLLQERFPSIVSATEGVAPIDAEGEVEIFLAPVQSLTFAMECINAELCGQETEGVTMATDSKSDSDKDFYFYAAIVIAAALLLYIMLRRLPPEEELVTRKNPNELH